MTESECCSSEVFSMEDYGFYSDMGSCCTDSTLEDTTLDSPESPTPPLILSRTERSVSLSSALKKPNRKGNKKVVHFADSLGLELVNIHQLSNCYDSVDELFGTTPPLYLKGFHESSYITTVIPPRKYSTVTLPSPAIYLHTHFTTLGRSIWQDDGKTCEKLINKVMSNGVCLKSVNTIGTNITGIIAVANYCYKKQVWVRYTMDKWRSNAEVPSLFVSCSDHKDIDTFSFSVFLSPNIPVGAKCEFCIRYVAGDKEYWDNNDRANYLVECRSLEEDNEDEGFHSLKRRF